MDVITNFINERELTIDDLIVQLSEIRKARGNLPVFIPVEISINGQIVYTFGRPRKAKFNEHDNTAEIELKNYFEV